MPLKTHLDEQPTLNLTSMIDVVFQLIIFFMVGTRFASIEHKIGVQVPQVGQAAARPSAPPKMVVHVKRDGTVLLDSTPITLDELGRKLREVRATDRNASVVVRGDGEGSFQSVASALATAREAGIVDLGISVRVARDGGVGARAASAGGVRR